MPYLTAVFLIYEMAFTVLIYSSKYKRNNRHKFEITYKALISKRNMIFFRGHISLTGTMLKELSDLMKKTERIDSIIA